MEQGNPAAQRFWVLQFLRLSGVAMVIVGAMILTERIAAPQALGAVLFLLGVIEFFFLPFLLARHWKRSGQ